jgi:cytochrome b561
MQKAQARDYGLVTKLLHWLVLGLLAAQFAIAWTMPEVHRGTRPDGLIAWHLSLGTLIMLLIVIRVLWRLTHPAPPLPTQLPQWQQTLARLTHFLLYAILLVLPLLGWGNASSRGWDVRLFGIVPLPRLFAQGSHFGHELGDIHTVASYVLLGLVGLHSAAALYHHFVAKNRVLIGMLPGFSRT